MSGKPATTVQPIIYSTLCVSAMLDLPAKD